MLRILPMLGALVACIILLVRDHTALQHATADRALLERRLVLLDAENERMRGALAREERDRKEKRERELRTGIEHEVEAIRGLKFKEPVDYDVVTRKEIKAVLTGKLAEVYSEQEFAAIAAALARLGVVPERYPLREKFIALLGEQIAAFYDQHRRKLFMFEDASLENAQNRVILAHELTHALQDQHFGLLKLPLELKDNDDRGLAASALVEGEATQVMTDYMMRNLSLQTLKQSMGSAFTQDARQLAAAPPFLRETLLFPYLRGQEFCGAISGGADYAALSRCYARLPSSSAEILHPERYRADWTPVAVAWPDPTLEGRRPSVSNVLGEEGVRIQLSTAIGSKAAETVAAHWRGDRYLHFGERDALVWQSVWEDAASAREFTAAERKGLMKRYGLKSWSTTTPGGRGLALISPAPEIVMLIDAPSPDVAARLAERFAPVRP